MTTPERFRGYIDNLMHKMLEDAGAEPFNTNAATTASAAAPTLFDMKDLKEMQRLMDRCKPAEPNYEGLPVYVSELATKKRWIPPPRDGFWEYEESDEQWASFFGLGHYVRDPCIIHCNLPPAPPYLLIHPDLYEKMPKASNW